MPSRRTNLFLVRHKGSEVISGYILTKQRHFDDVTQRHVKDVTIAAVQDWMSFEPDRLPEHHLLALALSATLSPDGATTTADAVEICTSGAEAQRWLRRWRLVPMGQLNFLCKPARGADLADEKWRGPANWRLRPAEGDNFWT